MSSTITFARGAVLDACGKGKKDREEKIGARWDKIKNEFDEANIKIKEQQPLISREVSFAANVLANEATPEQLDRAYRRLDNAMSLWRTLHNWPWISENISDEDREAVHRSKYNKKIETTRELQIEYDRADDLTWYVLDQIERFVLATTADDFTMSQLSQAGFKDAITTLTGYMEKTSG